MASAIGSNSAQAEKVLQAFEALNDASNGYESFSTGIVEHDDTRWVKPVSKTLADGAELYAKASAAEKEPVVVNHEFKYHPHDGAYATTQVLYKAYGHVGYGRASFSMFGMSPAQVLEIQIGIDETAIIPWGDLEVPDLKAVFSFSEGYDREYGRIFRLSVTTIKKHENAIRGFFRSVENELQTNSIYKGKAITGDDNPEFFDPYSTDRTKVVYNATVYHSLLGLLWHPIRFAAKARELGISLKRSTLLAGTFGTGKTLTANITAQEAVENGWTFIKADSDDDLAAVMTRAKLYQPAVVFYEDIDQLAAVNEGHHTEDKKDVSKLLDVFDGIQTKGTEVMVVMTTNHVETLTKGLMRPGRMDGIIEIEGFDANGAARLVLALAGDQLDTNNLDALHAKHAMDLGGLGPDASQGIDLDVVGKELEGFPPAFIAEAIKRAQLFNLDKSNHGLTTEDFVWAARSLLTQFEMYQDADEFEAAAEVDTAIENVVVRAIAREREEASV